MRATALKKLIGIQNARLAEIRLMCSRVKEKPRDSLNLSIVNSRIEAVRSIWSEAQTTHAEILSKDEAESDSYMIDNVFSILQVTYEDTLDYFLSLVAEFEKEVSAPSSLNQTRQGSISRPAKLPKLDLPTFSGKYEDWESFSDLFLSLVHNASDVDDSTKLQYLKSCLVGPASDLVKDVSTTSANYASTWQALKARFYNPRLTVFNHINALLNMPHLKKESAKEMRSFADEAQRIVRALTNLKMPVQYWDVWFVHIVSSRLDTESRKQWESDLSVKDRVTNTVITSDDIDHLSRFPSFAELASFLEKRAHALSMISCGSENRTEKSHINASKSFPMSRKILHSSSRQSNNRVLSKCPLCTGLHFIGRCPDFLAKTAYARRSDVRHLRLCYNCLGRHKFRDCPSSSRCITCREKHHTLIHFNDKPAPVTISKAPEKNGTIERTISVEKIGVHTANMPMPKYPVILATAQVSIVSPQGVRTRVRALLDQGSEASFITEDIVQLLKLPKLRIKIPLSVLGGGTVGSAKAKVNFTLQSNIESNLNIAVEALVLPRLTSQLPSRSLIELDLEQFSELTLADPQFYIADTVDLILGADVYNRLIRPGLRRFESSTPIAQDTTLGWVLSGPLHDISKRRAAQKAQPELRTLHCAPRDELSSILEKFWTLEELPHNEPLLKPEEEACEHQFTATHSRAKDGRYTVRLPFKGDLPAAGSETRHMALDSLKYMYRRFTRDPELAIAYTEFMSSYEKLGHMARVPLEERDKENAWYLPHHAVINMSKIRVVFDASRQTRGGLCLNDHLMTGPPLQQDLSLILLNWRKYRFVFTADIIKMFRQIRVSNSDQDFQRIVWAPKENVEPKDYRLKTVTYGTACAPYLAIRTLSQLAKDERSRFPLGAVCLECDTYVDDTFAGADELQLAVRKRTELVDLLASAGIQLDKWAANSTELLPSNVHQNEAMAPKELDSENSVKTLGIHWNPTEDTFNFRTLAFHNPLETVTKRSVLSCLARLFDPLGWLSPITITAKVIMQDLWIARNDWDAPLPEDIHKRWSDYCNSLSDLPTLSIGRWLGTSENQQCELHGFSDASSRAFAAAVYLRVKKNNDCFRVILLAARTKVAPVKTVSIPNLELCGAALLVKLVCHLSKLQFLKELPTYLWSDSEIVLKWLNRHPCYWKTFVANRVSQIQTQLPAAKWLHVPMKQNPADIATRGSSPADLHDSNPWWHGPEWLTRSSEC